MIAVTSLVIVVDIHIINVVWIEHAEDEVLKARGTPKRRRKWPLVFRLLLAIVLSGSMGMFLDLKIFEREIMENINRHYRENNAALEAEVRAAVSSEVAELETEQATLLAARKTISDRIAALEDHGDTDVARLVGEVGREEEEIAAIDAKIAKIESDKATVAQSTELEAQGVKVEGRTTGKSGCGPQCQLLQSELRRLDNEIAILKRERVRHEEKRNALASEKQSRAAKAQDQVPDKLREMRSLRQAREERLAAIENKLAGARDRVKGLIQERMREDARYVPLADGLAARFVALHEVIEEKPSILVPVTLVSLVMIMLELNAVLSKVFFTPKSTYGIITVWEYNEVLGSAATERAHLGIYVPEADVMTHYANEAREHEAKRRATQNHADVPEPAERQGPEHDPFTLEPSSLNLVAEDQSHRATLDEATPSQNGGTHGATKQGLAKLIVEAEAQPEPPPAGTPSKQTRAEAIGKADDDDPPLPARPRRKPEPQGPVFRRVKDLLAPANLKLKRPANEMN